jgi:transposase-like protein
VTAPGPMADGLPDIDTVAAIEHPVERAKRICEVARQFGTLPAALARLRIEAFREALADGRKVVWVATRCGITPSRVSRLVRTATSEAAA